MDAMSNPDVDPLRHDMMEGDDKYELIYKVVADRGFFSVKVLQTIVSRGIKYLIPCRNTGGVTRAIEEFARNERGRVV